MLRPSSRARLAFAVAGATLAVTAPAAHASFYDPPADADLPAENGAVIKDFPMKLGVNVSTPNGYARRIMYKSTDTNGNPVAVTGVYIEPKKAWTGSSGPRPLVAYAEGTQGQGDKCAPSYGLSNAITSTKGATNIAYEVPNIAGLVDKGIAVVVTDYIGLGTPNLVHTYVNRVDEGHAVLDAARAALNLPDTDLSADSAVGTYGYSQGGGASASAAELAPTYAPELNLKGAFAGAPPADLMKVMRTADGTSLTAVIGYAVNGFIQTYPFLKPILDENTNAAGKAALAKVAGGCIGDGLTNYAFQKTNSWSTSGLSIATIVSQHPEVQAVVDAQRIGRLKPAVPVRVITGTMDDIVTHSQVKQMAIDWCTLGAKVSYRPVVQYVSSFGTSLNHLGPMLTDGAASQTWIAQRLSGQPEAGNCGSIPRMQ